MVKDQYDDDMIKHYTMFNKPDFKDGQEVNVDMSVMGSDAGILTGTIVGKNFTNIIDTWLIQFDRNFAPSYPFKVVPIMHTAIIEE